MKSVRCRSTYIFMKQMFVITKADHNVVNIT
jgi:hypothetical protein